MAGPWVLEHSYGALWAWGVIESGFAAGTILGGAVAARVTGPTATMCIGSLFPLLMVLVGLALGWNVWVLVALTCLAGAALTVAEVHWMTRIQEDVAEDMTPGVLSLDYLLSEGLAPLGYLLVPLLFALWSVDATLLGIGAVVRFLSTFAAPRGRTHGE